MNKNLFEKAINRVVVVYEVDGETFVEEAINNDVKSEIAVGRIPTIPKFYVSDTIKTKEDAIKFVKEELNKFKSHFDNNVEITKSFLLSRFQYCESTFDPNLSFYIEIPNIIKDECEKYVSKIRMLDESIGLSMFGYDIIFSDVDKISAVEKNRI